MYAEADLIERLRLSCGERHVLTTAGELAAYRPLPAPHNLPIGAPPAGFTAADLASAEQPFVVVLPASVREVAAVVGACSVAEVPYCVRGAGTTLPVSAAVVIVLTRLRTVHTVDLANQRVEVDCGVPVATLRRRLAPRHTVLAELAAPRSATVGGAIAAGAGRGSLTALEIVDRDGLLVQLDADAPGYDLCGDLIGSAGRRAIIVRATLRLSQVLAPQAVTHSAAREQLV